MSFLLKLASVTSCFAILGAILLLPETAQRTPGATPAKKDSCRYAGEWVADNGDMMTLGLLQQKGGTYTYRSASYIPERIIISKGLFHISGNTFHFEGLDAYNERKDGTFEFWEDDPTSPHVIRLVPTEKNGKKSQVFRKFNIGACR